MVFLSSDSLLGNSKILLYFGHCSDEAHLSFHLSFALNLGM